MDAGKLINLYEINSAIDFTAITLCLYSSAFKPKEKSGLAVACILFYREILLIKQSG